MTVEFNELECCALCKAFEENPQLIAEFDKFMPDDRIEIYQEILVNTSGMRFPLTDEAADIYRSFALSELKRLGELDQNKQLSCAHLVSKHIKSLQAVVKKMNSEAN